MAKKATAPKLMTIRDAEQKTGMSRQTLTNWLDSGLLPGMRTSRSIWVSTEAIDKLAHSTVNIGNIQKEVEKLNEQVKAQKAEMQFFDSISRDSNEYYQMKNVYRTSRSGIYR